MISLTPVSFPALEYAPLTFPRFRPLLDGADGAVAVGALVAGEPAGLALAGIGPDPETVSVLSIAVGPEYRGQGVGTALLRKLERELARRFSRAEAVFTEATASFPYVKRMFEGQGWGPAQPHMLICRTTVHSILQAPWMHRSYLPPQFTIFPWCELRESERAALREQRDCPYPRVLSPFYDELPIEPVSSIGLRYHGTVVGWFITNLVSPDTLRITCMYVRPDLAGRARAVSLLIESMARYDAHPVSRMAPNGVFGIHVGNRPMMDFAQRRLAPYMTGMYYSYRVSKSIAEPHHAFREA